MARSVNRTEKRRRKLPVLVACAALALGVPSVSFAVVDATNRGESFESRGIDLFTPASVDPELASRIAVKAREKGIRFTPARATRTLGERTVTIAVRVDGDQAKAISVRSAIDAAPGRGAGITGLQPSKFTLGSARGYKSFARPVELPASVRRMNVPDLAEFEPSRPEAEQRPSRLQPRIELEDREIAGRSPNTLDSLGAQTVDLGGSFRLSPNLDVTAGVRLSQERERLDPLTNSVQDSQAVYVGTQIRF